MSKCSRFSHVQDFESEGLQKGQQCSSSLRTPLSGSLYGSGDLGSPVSLSARPALRTASKLRTARALRGKGPGVAHLSPHKDGVMRLTAGGEALLPSGSAGSRINGKCMTGVVHARGADASGTLTPLSTRSPVDVPSSSDTESSLFMARTREFASAPIEASHPSSPVNTPPQTHTVTTLSASRLPRVPALPIPDSAAAPSSNPLDPPSEGGGENVGEAQGLVSSPLPRTRTPRALAQRLPATFPEYAMVKEPAEVLMDASGVLQWPSGISGLSGSTANGGVRVFKFELVDTGALSSGNTVLSSSRRISNDTEMSVSKYEVLGHSLLNTLDGSETPMTSIRSERMPGSMPSPPPSESMRAFMTADSMRERSETETAFMTPTGSVWADSVTGGSTRGSPTPPRAGVGSERGVPSPTVKRVWEGMGLFGQTSEASVEVVDQEDHAFVSTG